jgi:hypothetical protein
MSRYSFREPVMLLTSKHNMQVTAYDNKPDVIQLFYDSLNMHSNTEDVRDFVSYRIVLYVGWKLMQELQKWNIGIFSFELQRVLEILVRHLDMYKVAGNAKCSFRYAFNICPSSFDVLRRLLRRMFSEKFVMSSTNLIMYPQDIISEEYTRISQNHVRHILCIALRNLLFYMWWVSFYCLSRLLYTMWVTAFRAEIFPTLIFVQGIIIFSKSEVSYFLWIVN